jgi:hypothetical protein
VKIKCPLCDFNNEDGARFCSNCNEPLSKPNFSDDNPYLKKVENKEENMKEEWIPDNKKRREKDQSYIKEVISKDKSSELFLDDLVKENVDNKKRLRTCGNCGASLPDGVTKCPECEKAVCKNCGNVLGTNVTKCPKCGELTTLGTIQSIGWTLFGLGLFIYIILFFLNNL